jgi:hypothetical protein
MSHNPPWLRLNFPSINGDTTMRKFILITAMVLASATAQAGERSLTLGSDNAAPAAPAATAETPQATETPKYVERPALVEPKVERKAEQPKIEDSKLDQSYTQPAPEKTAPAPKPRRTAQRTRYWTEGRIINELHRHGIYW